MSPEQVRVIYEHCRQVAKVLTSEMRRLLTEIVKYRADKRHRNNLRSALVELLRCMPMNVETIEKLKKDVDWTLVESVAERTSMNQKSSALYEVLEFPSRLIALIESTLIAPENNNDGCIDLLAFVAQRGIYGEITERNLFAEEGRVLDRLKRGPIKSEYLGIVVDELRKQVSRGKSIPQQLTDLTLSLCQYLVKCAAAGATAEAVDAHLERIGQEKTARRAAVNKLREHIAPLGLTVTNAKETKRYTIVEDGT